MVANPETNPFKKGFSSDEDDVGNQSTGEDSSSSSEVSPPSDRYVTSYVDANASYENSYDFQPLVTDNEENPELSENEGIANPVDSSEVVLTDTSRNNELQTTVTRIDNNIQIESNIGGNTKEQPNKEVEHEEEEEDKDDDDDEQVEQGKEEQEVKQKENKVIVETKCATNQEGEQQEGKEVEQEEDEGTRERSSGTNQENEEQEQQQEEDDKIEDGEVIEEKTTTDSNNKTKFRGKEVSLLVKTGKGKGYRKITKPRKRKAKTIDCMTHNNESDKESWFSPA